MQFRSMVWVKYLIITALSILASAFSTVAAVVESTPDYSVLTQEIHPRIIYDADGFAQLRKLVKSGENKVISLFHSQLMAAAEDALSDTSPLEYVKDASNKRILAVSGRASRRLVPCAYAYRMTGKKKYLKKAEKDILAVCSFPDWNPKHFLDVAEMACGVSLAYDWLYHDLKPAVKAEAVRALRDYALQPSRLGNRKYTWFYNTANNWNSICNAGLVCSAFAIYEHCPEMARSVIDDAVRTNRPALEEIYAPDGAYPEGPSYWKYGTTFQVLMLTAMESVLGTDFGLSEAPGFMKTGLYIVHSQGTSGKYFNFSDTGENVGTNPALWYFASKLNSPSLVDYDLKRLAGEDYHKASYGVSIPVAMKHALVLDFDGERKSLDNFYQAHGPVDVMMCRSGWGRKDHYLGIKGGRDGYNHGHMDGGSFVYDAYGVRWAKDLTRQGYAEMEKGLAPFGKRLIDPKQDSWRWKIFRINCRQHNTLTVNDKDHDVNAFVKMTATENSPERMSATFDMTPLFWGDLAKAERTAALCDGNHLEIKDVLAAPADRPAHVRWSMVTGAVPELTENGIVLTSGKVKMLLKAEGADVAYKIWSADPQDYDSPIKHLEKPNPNTYICGYEIDIPMATEYTITITLIKN